MTWFLPTLTGHFYNIRRSLPQNGLNEIFVIFRRIFLCIISFCCFFLFVFVLFKKFNYWNLKKTGYSSNTSSITYGNYIILKFLNTLLRKRSVVKSKVGNLVFDSSLICHCTLDFFIISLKRFLNSIGNSELTRYLYNIY